MSSELTQIQLDIAEVKVDVAEIKVALKGYNGQIGLCQQVEKTSVYIKRLTIAVVLIASSLGGGVWGVVQLLLGK